MLVESPPTASRSEINGRTAREYISNLYQIFSNKKEII
jgi:hypothetical protein